MVLNLPQAVLFTSNALVKVAEFGRGTGKTTYRGAHWSEIIREMPRSSGALPASTYKDMLSNIVPSLIQGLEMFGYYEGLHYFIGERPPRNWRNSWGTAYQPPKGGFDHYITFWNGTGAHMLSQDLKGDGRGLNIDWLDVDEAAKLDGSRLQQDVEPTLRGTNVRAFKKSKYFGSRFISTSAALEEEGTWYQQYEEQALYNPKKYLFVKATSHHNAANLRPGFLEEAKENAYSETVYLAEYENVRPNIVKDGFYPLLDARVHAYNDYNYKFITRVGQELDCRGDNDLVRGQPLIIAADFGAAINSCSTNQFLRSINEYRTLKSMYALGEDKKIQDDLYDTWHKYYLPHQASCPEVYFWYDNQGNAATGNTRYTRAQQVQKQLNAKGWKVQLMTTGQTNVLHDLKYVLFIRILSEKDPRYPKYRINKGNAPELWISMRLAKARKSPTGLIQKVKNSEKKGSKLPRQHATDLSDANDTALWGMFGYLVNGFGGSLPGDFHNRS